jgi:hypothetical protein
MIGRWLANNVSPVLVGVALVAIFWLGVIAIAGWIVWLVVHWGSFA